MKTFGVGLGLLVYLWGATVFALPKCSELKTLWNDTYKNAVGGVGELDKDCLSDNALLADALHLLKRARPKLYLWAVGLIDETYILGEDPDYNASMESETKIMRLYDGFFRKTIEDRAATIIHEASHNVTVDHVECLQGWEEGSPFGCDETFKADWEGGAYNYHFMALHALRNSAKKFHDIKKAAIDIKSKYLLLNKFNHITNKQVQAWGGDKILEKPQGSPGHWALAVESYY